MVVNLELNRWFRIFSLEPGKFHIIPATDLPLWPLEIKKKKKKNNNIKQTTVHDSIMSELLD